MTESGSAGTASLLLQPGAIRIVLAGEIDADLAPELAEVSDEVLATRLPVEVDAHHITFMDSSGVAFLAQLATQLPGQVRVLRAPPTVKFLLDVTRVGDLLEVV